MTLNNRSKEAMKSQLHGHSLKTQIMGKFSYA